MMDIVMIPFHDCKKWFTEGFRTRDAHLAQHFCNDERVNKILVINRPTSLAERIAKRVDWRTSKVAHNTNIDVIDHKSNYEIAKISSKMYCLDIALPDFLKVAREKKLWWQTAFQYSNVLGTIKYAEKKLNLEDPILFLENPMAINVARTIGYNIFAFDAIDNWLYHPQMRSNHNVIAKNYEYVDRNADIIFTVSESLTHTFNNNNNVHWVANGVDVEYFKPARKKWSEGEKITIGYTGKIQDRVDFKLVETCLKHYPDINFIFYGPIYSQKNRVKYLKKKYKNIIFTGDINYADLPKEMKRIDLAIIPHKVDNFTNSMNPLKLYEYLAAGKPVLTTGVAGISGISKYVYIENDENFVKYIGILSEKIKKHNFEPENIANDIPKNCRWSSRSKTIIDDIEKMI